MGALLLSLVALAAGAAGLASGAGASQPARAARVTSCGAAQTITWLGDGEGGGAAGHVYYPLEFSNVGHSPCTLYGYPGVSAVGANGRQIGAAGARSGPAAGVVTIAPGGTAHALLAIADWGAICSHAVNAFGIRVYAPGERASQLVEFPFEACAIRGVLSVGPVRAGVGIPGYTNS